MKITQLVSVLNWLAINLSINQTQTYKKLYIDVKLDIVFIYIALMWCKFNKSIIITV